MNKDIYEYVVIGAGISGCSVVHELKIHSSSILLIDRLKDVGSGASGAAGAFLSPLLGKPNKFKDLITTSLKYSTQFYKMYTPEFIDSCGTTRIPKDNTDIDKFKSYIPYIDFEFIEDEKGYFFPYASVVDSYNICKLLSKDITTLFNYEVKSIEYIDGIWIIDNRYKTKNLIMTTGYCISLIDEFYFNIRAVWGQRIVIETSTCITHNYHKECSVSRTIQKDKDTYISSIGATHHRFVEDKKIDKNDTRYLLKKATDILPLDNIKVVKEIAGARASSVDYIPMIGKLIDSKKTISEFPYLKNGTNVNSKRFTKYDNLYVLNGVGGRGFVLAPYLAKVLVDNIVYKKEIDEMLKVDRLFKREVKRLK